MSTGQTIALLLQLGVFLAWAGVAYSVWSTLKNRADADGKGISAQFRAWWGSSEDRSTRNTLLFLTFALVVMQVQSAALG